MADPKEWGPTLWKIIHICSENLGKHSKQIIQKDELLYFNMFQKKLATILPCKICKTHYIEYMKNIKEVSYAELKDYGKKYYYNLHKEINDEKQIVSPEYTDLVNIYGKVSYTDMNNLVKTLNNLYLKYFMLKYINTNDYKEFQRILSMLRHIISI
jgi:hypothetical protein